MQDHFLKNTARAARRLSLGFALALVAPVAVAQAQIVSATAPPVSGSVVPQSSPPGATQSKRPGEARRARRVGVQPAARPAAAPAGAGTPTAAVASPGAVVTKAAGADAKEGTVVSEAAEPEAVATRSGAGSREAKDKDATGTKSADAGAKNADAEGLEAELRRRRAQIKEAEPVERARLQRALVERLAELNRRDEAVSELRLMSDEDRIDPAFFYNTGNALARLGDANAAADAYRKAISQRKGNYARALNNLGVVLTRQGRWEEAHDALVAALTQENFTYAEASYNLGRLHLLRGETGLAIREWTRTLQLAPDHAEAAVALARAYAEDGEGKRAAAVLENFAARARRAGGEVPRQVAAARRDLIEVGETYRASASAADAPASARGSVPVPAGTNAARRVAAAARPFSLDPRSYALLQSARDARERGRLQEAINFYRGVLARNGGYFAPANLELGFALMNLTRNDEALAALAPVAERDGARYPVAYYHLARIYERQNQLDRAARAFAQSAELYGDENPQVLLDLSRIREKSGDFRGALAALESYLVSIGRQGSLPDWADSRLAQLREKAKNSPAPNAPPKQ